jgi:hypothetical protein
MYIICSGKSCADQAPQCSTFEKSSISVQYDNVELRYNLSSLSLPDQIELSNSHNGAFTFGQPVTLLSAIVNTTTQSLPADRKANITYITSGGCREGSIPPSVINSANSVTGNLVNNVPAYYGLPGKTVRMEIKTIETENKKARVIWTTSFRNDEGRQTLPVLTGTISYGADKVYYEKVWFTAHLRNDLPIYEDPVLIPFYVTEEMAGTTVEKKYFYPKLNTLGPDDSFIDPDCLTGITFVQSQINVPALSGKPIYINGSFSDAVEWEQPYEMVMQNQ